MTKKFPIIVIGPDNVGKSTLVELASKELGMESIHLIKVDDVEEFHSILRRDIAEGLKPDVIYDRYYYPDDMIYSPIVDGVPSRIGVFAQDIINKLREQYALIVLVTADKETLVERCKLEKGAYANETHTVRVLAAYKQFLAQTYIFEGEVDVWHLDATGLTPKQVLDEFIKIYQAHSLFMSLMEE